MNLRCEKQFTPIASPQRVQEKSICPGRDWHCRFRSL